MRINHNIAAISANRVLARNTKDSGSALEKLSSGFRINKAGDDAAGLAISEKMRSQIRGLDQASRNIQNAVSLVQTAEGAMGEVHSLLQRGRKLSVQAANGTNTSSDISSIQEEISQVLKEIDRIAQDTEYNTKKLLNSSSTDKTVRDAVINGLKSGWLEESAQLIKNYYGLDASNRSLSITLESTTGDSTLAYVASSWSTLGDTSTLNQLNLHIDLGDFAPATGPSGYNSGAVYDDRIIAHEMVHAIMADAMGDDFYDMPTWFKEGAAEFIPGADERLKADVSLNGLANIVSRAAALVGGASWDGTSKDYSAAYLAVKYIETNLKSGSTFKDVISGIHDNVDNSENTIQAIISNTNFTDQTDLASSISSNGATYYNTVIDVNDSDTGSIMGSDHGGSALNAEDVIPTGTYVENPSNFNVIFPGDDQWGEALSVQIGANAGQNMAISLFNVKTDALGVKEIDVTEDASGSITTFQNAIEKVSAYRSNFGALQNRLEHALMVSQNMSENIQWSESQIRDVDMAEGMMEYTKTNILSQATQAMLAQANQQPQSVLQLLTA